MTDRTDDVLASIDDELTRCICGQPIPDDGPSLDYCSDVCQYRYTAEQIGEEPSGEMTYLLPAAETDGRAINAEVNRRFRSGAYTDDPFDGLMHDHDVAERLHEAAGRAARHLRVPDTRHAATFQRAEVANPAAPTLAELDSGTDLTAEVATVRSGDLAQRIADTMGIPNHLQPDTDSIEQASTAETFRSWERTIAYQFSVDIRGFQEACERLSAALQGISVEQAAENVRQLGEQLRQSEPPDTTDARANE